MSAVKVLFLSPMLGMSCVIPRAGDGPNRKLFGMHAVGSGEKALNWRKQSSVSVRKVSQSQAHLNVRRSPIHALYHIIIFHQYSTITVCFLPWAEILGRRRKSRKLQERIARLSFNNSGICPVAFHIGAQTPQEWWSTQAFTLIYCWFLTYPSHASVRVDLR